VGNTGATVLDAWEVAACDPGRAATPGELPHHLAWQPWTYGGALPPHADADGADWWFRTTLPPVTGTQAALHFDGLATRCTVFVDGHEVLASDNMFITHDVAIAPGGARTLSVRCAALSSFEVPRRPRSRWRTRLVADPALRFVRTSFIGRMPGWSHGTPIIGPWRPVTLLADTSEPGRTAPAAERRVTVRTDDGGFALAIDGVEVFARGVCITHDTPSDLATATAQVARLVAAGCTMVRITGTGTYASEAWLRACDEAGLLVWHDLMLANLDYPVDDEGWWTSFSTEVRQFLTRCRHHPSVVVVCGGSEVLQQAAMMGVAPAAVDRTLIDRCAAMVAELLPTAVWVDGSPSGGPMPFSIGAGVSHYFGVGAYRRPLADARSCGVRFASECLAFANVPDRTTTEQLIERHGPPGSGPGWAQLVPRDRGATWDFEDVRDHYVGLLFGVQPGEVRWSDPDRYLDLGRAAVAAVIESTIDEWRTAAHPCRGAMVLMGFDVVPGCGWGVIDSEGRPKSAFYALQRASRPVRVALTDHGLDGVRVHVHHDPGVARTAALRLATYATDGTVLHRAERSLELTPHSSITIDAWELLGHFADLNHAYGFGPRHVDVIHAVLADDAGEVIDATVLLPAGHRREVRSDLGVDVSIDTVDGEPHLRLAAMRFVHFVNLEARDADVDDDWFHLCPGEVRSVPLRRRSDGPVAVTVRALDSSRSVTQRWEPRS
jgi:beta-mannosidase